MTITALQKYRLKKFCKELSSYKALHTEFVSVYVPADYELIKTIGMLYQEKATAENIKSATTRKNVIAALEKMISHLKQIASTPKNGLAVFAGNVAAKEGEIDVRVWSIEPPAPLKTKIYRCGKEFVLDPLLEFLEEKDVYGLVVMDSRDSMLGLLKGKTLIPLTKFHSHVPGKIKAGGQSALRFQHNRELALKEHIKKTIDLMKEHFLKISELKGILLGGPGPIKYQLLESTAMTGELKKRIIAIKDLSYTEEVGLQELVDRSQDVLAKEEVAEEKRLVTNFLELLAKQPSKAIYGLEKVVSALNLGAVALLLISEALEEKTIDELSEIAKKFKTEFKIISVETPEGKQLRDLGKVGAVLRWAIKL